MILQTPEGPIECLDAGEGGVGAPTVILVHGIQGTAAVWRPLMDALSPGRRVLAPNLRGRGLSVSPTDPGAYTMAGFAADLRAVVLAAGDPVVLIGWSMGCLVALEYLRRNGQDGLVGLGLISGSACLAPPGGEAAVWLRGDTAEELAADAAARARRLKLAATATHIAAAGAWLSASRADYRTLLPEITLPTLVLHGDEDLDCPPTHGAALARAIAGARFDLWPGCGHVPMAHDPQRLAATLGAFLRDCVT